ncbi:SDR family oxidoreductase [Microbacterium gorillae]|uniref:SDR family oxidoreductase n=1 Tax=Microbacterium gorillae TaxID=1231063 RepID=UPI000B9C0BC4|nr:SDR family oxidoreductase [Microbacterium gorillae]
MSAPDASPKRIDRMPSLAAASASTMTPWWDVWRERFAVIAGAGGAIGEAVADRFRAEGAVVIGIDRQDGTGRVDHLHVADLRDEAEVEQAVAAILAEHGRVDVLYNNAGTLNPQDRSLESSSMETWRAVFDDLVTPVVLTCKHVVPVTRGQASGSIINTGSFLAEMGAASAQTAFSAAMAAVIQISRDLGVHLATSGVRVNSLSIGPVESPQSAAMFARLPAAALAERLAHIPTGRFATVTEVAAVAAFLASDDSSYLTASDLPVDGGIRRAYTVPEGG